VDWLVHAELAYLLLLAGVCLVVADALSGGIGAGMLLGLACLGLAVAGLRRLATDWVAVAALVLALGLVIADLQARGVGLLALLGTADAGVAASGLFRGSADLPAWLIVATVPALGAVLVAVLGALTRARTEPAALGPASMVGLVAEVRERLAPHGTVTVRGALWQARVAGPDAAVGERVEVCAVEGLLLVVRRLPGA